MWSILLIVLGLSGLSPSEGYSENFMKTSVNPCEDFYQYCCGKWSEVNVGVEHGDTLSFLDLHINLKIAGHLEANQEQEVLVKMKTLYSSCRNLKTYNLYWFLNSVKPKSGWPIYEEPWEDKDFDWLETIAVLRTYGVNIFLDQTVMSKWDNASVNIIYLDLVKSYSDSKASLVQILKKASIDTANAETIANELVDFEEQLRGILPITQQSADNDDTEEVVLGYLSESLPQIDWVKYLAIVFGRQLDLYTPMIIQNTEVMSRLGEFLNKTESRQVCNYIMVKFLQFLDQYSIGDTSPNECITALHQSMPLAVSQIIESHFYDAEYEQVVQDLFNFLKVEFLAEVSKLYEKQRDVLLFLYTKASVMELRIGNARRNLTLDDVTIYYASLQFKDELFYDNLLSAFKFKTIKEQETLNNTRIDIVYQWTVTSSPFFVQSKNQIVVPLTLLQDSVFGKNSADKYGVLGFILGHEFIHAFDVTGVSYDYEGSMVESAISRNPTFSERVRCVEKQMHSKGIGEKIADLGGIRLAFDAYRRSLMQHGKNITFNDGSERTLGQSFFISFAQFFCGINKKGFKPHSGSDVHEADELRVKTSLMNFEEFSNAFACPDGTVMNPEKKCRVW